MARPPQSPGLCAVLSPLRVRRPRVAQIRNAPYGHDARSMASAMGKNWGSNVERSIKAREQAQKVNTSSADPDDEDDITMA